MTEEGVMADDVARFDALERMVDSFNDHDLDAIMSLFVDDCVFESPRGPNPWGRRYTGQAAQVRVCFPGGSYFDA